MRRLLFISAVGLCVSATSAWAESVCKIVQYSKAKVAFVAQPGKLREFYTHVRAGKKLDAARVVVCVPAVGDKIIITDRGVMFHTIRVLSGQFEGCVGDVAIESVGDCQ